ncbi:MAG: clostripain-related cysteine peptidase [Anaerolineales bacterium]
MRKMSFAFSVLIVLVLLASMTGSAAAAPAAQAKWTVMVYISGDNNLEDYVVKDIETELAPTGSTANVQVVALADRGPGYDTSYGDWQTTKLFHVTQGMKADAASAVVDWGEKNMGDPQTLIDFVNWSKTNYPADHYALIFWGHGWAWRPGVVMRDDTNNDSLDYTEEKAAIPSLGFIDVVGYDGCNMASIEIFNLWRGHATAVTGSQEYVGWEGLQYDLVLAQMAAANGNMTADQVAVAFAQSATADKTWSAIAVDSRFDALFTAVDQWSVALTNGLAANRKKYDSAFNATRTFWQAPMDKDLYDMAYEMKNKVSDTNIKNKSQAVMDAVNSVVLYDRHVNAYADTYGITVYHISKASEKDSNYNYYRSTVDFALQTSWDEFVNAYASSGKQ